MFDNYYNAIKNDFNELKRYYPYCSLTQCPTSTPQPVIIKVIAANKKLVDEFIATEDDFKGEYTKELYIEVPFNYKNTGCDVYGAPWLEIDKIPDKDQHFNGEKDGLYKLCVGVPESFSAMKNVLLENVKTAENMLIAYQMLQTGESTKLNLKSYSHGKCGENEYRKDRKKYKCK